MSCTVATVCRSSVGEGICGPRRPATMLGSMAMAYLADSLHRGKVPGRLRIRSILPTAAAHHARQQDHLREARALRDRVLPRVRAAHDAPGLRVADLREQVARIAAIGPGGFAD